MTATVERPRRAWLGFSLSLLCLVHCLGTALLVPLLPALSFVAENEALEWTLLGLSAILAGRLCWRRRGWRLWLWGPAVGLGLSGAALGGERLVQLALVACAIIQLPLTRRRCACGNAGCTRCGGPGLTSLRRPTRTPP
jgi:hypothetical protein